MTAESFVPTGQDLAELVPVDSPARILLQGPPAPMCRAVVGRVRCLLSIDRVDGRDWFHVSASVAGEPTDRRMRRRKARRGEPASLVAPALPSWRELVAVRAALFMPEAVVVQVFPPVSEWYSEAEVLHLWQRLGPDRLIPDLRRAGGRL